MRSSNLIFVAMLLGMPVPCMGKQVLVLGVGPSVPVGDLAAGRRIGVHGIGMVHFGPARAVSFRIDASYSHFWAKEVGPGVNESARVVALGINAVVALRRRRTVSPYALAGLGTQTSTQDCPGTRTSASLTGGVGVRVRRVRLEGRVLLGATGCNSTYHIPFTVALSF